MKFRGKYYFLSNFYPAKITYRGFNFNSVEHGYQAFKAIYEEDFRKIQYAKSSKSAKRLGSLIPVRDDWDDIKLNIMYNLLEEKFSILYFKERLLEIDEPIIEENDWGDTFWGVYNGKGENNLGKLLTKIKNEIELMD